MLLEGRNAVAAPRRRSTPSPRTSARAAAWPRRPCSMRSTRRRWTPTPTPCRVGAQEYLRRNLAAELGSYGIRVLTIQTGGVPDSIPDEFAGKGEIARSIVAPTLLGRAASLEDIGNAAAFAASDWARTMTGSALNITCGTEIG